jgi:uncharacterized phage protein gp47/JayE
VGAEIDDLMRTDPVPGGTLLLSRIRTAIGSADGLANYTLTSPNADVVRTVGQLSTKGTVTYV